MFTVTSQGSLSTRLTGAILTILGAASLVGCLASPDDREPIDSTQEAAIVSNAIVSNAIVSNAIVSNAIVSNAIVSNAIVSNAIVSNAILSSSLEDPATRMFFSYMVSCALDASQSVSATIQGTPYTFQGQVGLAPQWGVAGGSCDESCQRWVSACLLARVDFLGVSEEISLRGQSPALTPLSAELSAYGTREATYFGNVFDAPQERYACLSPGKTGISRVCGPTVVGCVVDVGAGSCNGRCGRPQPDGSFPNCAPSASDSGPNDAALHYQESITVFLAP